MSLPDPQQQPTMTIPDAGALLGLSRSGAYRAAKSGHLPTIQIGHRKRVVPTALLRQLLRTDN